MRDWARIAQVAQQKWRIEQIDCFFERIAHLTNFLQKTSDSLRKPMSEFPALRGVKWPKFLKLHRVHPTKESSCMVCIRVGNSLLAHLLRSLRKNDRLWVNRSCQKINREWISQVAYNKRATVSYLLRSLMINEQIDRFFWSELIICSFVHKN